MNTDPMTTADGLTNPISGVVGPETDAPQPTRSIRGVGAPSERRNAKKDDAPRGVFRQDPRTWAIRFTCGAGHIHEETTGPLKGDAIRAHFARRSRALAESGWCPRAERSQTRIRAREAAASARRRQTFREYVKDYGVWAAVHKRSWKKTERYTAARLEAVLGEKLLEEITTADVERELDRLLEGRTGATRNRYRDLCSGMFKRALRLGLVPTNPVKGIPKIRETGQRLAFLSPAEEQAVRDALPERLRPAFTVAVHTGLRFSEQASLRWRDVDVLSNTITVELSKNGRPRRVPMNATVRTALVDLASRRIRPNDPDEQLFPLSYRQTAILFTQAVERARGVLRDGGQDPNRLEGVSWHTLRHTFASRLTMAGVDLRTVAELGGWRTLAMVQRYAHLSPAHLQAAVERLVDHTKPEPAPGHRARVELGLELDLAATATPPESHRDTLTPRKI
jgi:integrase